MSDHNLFKNDIKNRFPSAVIIENGIGTGFLIEVVIGPATIKGSWRTNLFDAYDSARETLLGGINPLLKSTSAQRNALTTIEEGTPILNTNSRRMEIYLGSKWVSAGGDSSGAPAALGSMFADYPTGHNISGSPNQYIPWTGASPGEFDKNGIITFLQTQTEGDRFIVGSEGKGVYQIGFDLGFTNVDSKLTTVAVHINGVEMKRIKQALVGRVNEQRIIAAKGELPLNVGDYVDLRFKSAGIITIYLGEFDIHREQMG